MTHDKLLEEWHALLERRPTFRAPLALYEALLTTWVAWSNERPAPLRWSAEECGERWRRGVPLMAEAPPPIAREDMEELLASALELVAGIGADGEALPRLAEAWDREEVGPPAFFPEVGRIGSASLQQAAGLSHETIAFLACASLRPLLEQYFADCRQHVASGAWALGNCPFCGAPPAFADLLEDGQRHLACHLCGGGWNFSRLRCPYCGNRDANSLIRLMAEDKEEGYAVFACKNCSGYLKELDRRTRWNVGPALVEDWGTPHLDLIAQRAGYWRAVPTLIQLETSK